ncbi:uncharacterized protein involved in type VI secretion and phage assembly, partial [Chitinivorax tropicus]
MSNFALLFRQALGRFTATNRLFQLVLANHPDALIVETVQGLESVLGAPLPSGAQALLPDAEQWPPGSLVTQQHAVPQPALGQLPITPQLQRGAADDPFTLFTGFRLVITVLSDQAQANLTELLGSTATLQLQTSRSRTVRRPFHGHITEVRSLGSNGGLARYQLVLEPWLACLRLQRDSWVFQEQSIPDILETVFQDYVGQGQLTPAWRFQLLDRSRYPQRSQVAQYQETDWHFIARLMYSEGLFGWFEHTDDRHTLVISDRQSFDAACQANPDSPLRYHRGDATERQDSFQHWTERVSRQPGRVRLSSWDYR